MRYIGTIGRLYVEVTDVKHRGCRGIRAHVEGPWHGGMS